MVGGSSPSGSANNFFKAFVLEKLFLYPGALELPDERSEEAGSRGGGAELVTRFPQEQLQFPIVMVHPSGSVR